MPLALVLFEVEKRRISDLAALHADFVLTGCSIRAQKFRCASRLCHGVRPIR
jgi:hypothetical protein